MILMIGFNSILLGCCVAKMIKEKVKLYMQYKAANKRKTHYTLQEDSTLINDVLPSSQYPPSGLSPILTLLLLLLYYNISHFCKVRDVTSEQITSEQRVRGYEMMTLPNCFMTQIVKHIR